MKGAYDDIPDENMIFQYASSENITFHGEYDSGFTIEEWKAMTDDQQHKELIDLFWQFDIVEFWMTEGDDE